jgi:uncharacterized damage-inducible protein DinB
VYPTLESRADVIKMLAEITAARRQLLAECARLRPRQIHNPVYPGTWSLLQNLAHLAWSEAYMLACILKRPAVLGRAERPPVPALHLGAIRTALDEAHAATIAFVKCYPESVLKEHCQHGRRGEQTVGGLLFHLIEHEIHHRAFMLHKLAKLAQAAEDDED